MRERETKTETARQTERHFCVSNEEQEKNGKREYERQTAESERDKLNQTLVHRHIRSKKIWKRHYFFKNKILVINLIQFNACSNIFCLARPNNYTRSAVFSIIFLCNPVAQINH